MNLENTLDRIHARVVAKPGLRLFTAVTRGLLALGFIEPGLTKVLGHRFTRLPTTNPIGYFFDAFFQAAAYYHFVGMAQVLAAVLLLFPETVALGAMLYLPIILNIFLITVSVGFEGTPFITGPMLLASVYLLCWEYPRWKAILPGFTGGGVPVRSPQLGVVATVVAGATAAAGAFGAALFARNVVEHRGALLAPIGIVCVAGVAAILVYRHYVTPAGAAARERAEIDVSG